MDGNQMEGKDMDEEDINDNDGATMLDQTLMTFVIWAIYGKVSIGTNSIWVLKVTFVY